MECVIIASGDFSPTPEIKKILKDCSMIICADGGARHLREQKIKPHVLIGDSDSIHPEDKSYFKKKQVQCIDFPSRKDQTDSELCIEWALQNKASYITLLGATGGRMDHTMANIFLLKKLLDAGIPAKIIDEKNEIHLVDDTLVITGGKRDYLSIIPVSENISGVTLNGLEYELGDADMNMGSTLGISNRFKTKRAVIKIQSGMALVIKSRD